MNKYVKAISTNLIFLFVNTIAFFVLTPLAIHKMGEEFYGLWAVLNAVMSFSSIGTLGIGSIVNKFSSEYSTEDREATNSEIIVSGLVIILPMAILTAILLWSISGIIVKNIQISDILKSQFQLAIKICAIGLIPQFLSKIPQGFLLSQIKNNLVRTMDFISNIFPWIGAILITVIDKNLVWIATWFLIVQLLIFGIYLIAISRYIRWQIAPKILVVKRMLKFSIFMFIESSAITLFQQFDRIIVGFTLGPVIAGVYSVGSSIGLRMSIITGQITEVMIPYASLKSSIGDNKTLKLTYRRMSRYISLLLGGLGSFCILWMHEILSIWISPDYANRYSFIFNVFIVAYSTLSLCRPAHQTLVGMGKVKFSSSIYGISSITMLLGVFILSKSFNFMGAASANTLMILLLAMNVRVYKLLTGKYNWGEWFCDLKWGLMLPIICNFVLYFSPTIGMKFLLSLALAIWFLYIFNNDTFAKYKISQIFSRYTKNTEA